jgi:hypothetical protein
MLLTVAHKPAIIVREQRFSRHSDERTPAELDGGRV